MRNSGGFTLGQGSAYCSSRRSSRRRGVRRSSAISSAAIVLVSVLFGVGSAQVVSAEPDLRIVSVADEWWAGMT